MKVVYIAGPYTGSTAWDIEQNVRSAEQVALIVARSGAAPLCPHANARFFYGQCTEEFWYEATIEMLRRCDGVVLTAGWENSKGACAEAEEAKRLEIPLFDLDNAPGVSLAALRAWARAPR
jgi:nucleoside 2-deoxyribosyltransferase